MADNADNKATITSKVTASHLKRDAFLYVRQSTLQQLVHNTESTQRQYQLRQRAVALGWPADRVHVLASNSLSAKSALAMPASCWGWKYPGSPATPPIGIA